MTGQASQRILSSGGDWISVTHASLRRQVSVPQRDCVACRRPLYTSRPIVSVLTITGRDPEGQAAAKSLSFRARGLLSSAPSRAAQRRRVKGGQQGSFG